MPLSTPNLSPEQENKYHTYVGSHIPWYVHLLWVMFWAFVVAYFLNWLIPAILTDPVLTKPR